VKTQFKKVMIIALLLIGNNLKSQIFINEIMVNPSGASDGANMPNTAEWIEFYNGSSSAVDVSCWFFTDGDFAVTFPSGTFIPAGGYFTVASALGTGLTPNLNWATCGCTSGPASEVGIFTNSAEQVLLYNSSGVIVDAIIWSTGQLPDGMITSALGSCSSQNVTFPANGSTYESIGTNSDGIAKERDTDGSNTWQNTSTPTFGSTNAPIFLPIELTEFKAEFINSIVSLSWSTASEMNNDHFVIERSKNGFEFETIQEISGAGTSLELKNYSIIDKYPLDGLSYYRLKQIDYSGNFSYSTIEYIEANINSNLRIDILPNPSENGRFELIVKDKEPYEICVYGTTGNLIYYEICSEERKVVDVNHLDKGIYFLTIRSNGKFFSKKLMYQ
jgi:hypothetical protein